MPELNSYDVTIVLQQKNIQAETAAEALAVMETNIEVKRYVKPIETTITKTNP